MTSAQLNTLYIYATCSTLCNLHMLNIIKIQHVQIYTIYICST